jgi:hypothetical protein
MIEKLEQETNYDEDTIAAIKAAAAKGFYTVLPADNQLQIDIDSEAGLAQFDKFRDLIKQQEHWDVLTAITTPSKEAGHFHITVTLKDNVTPLERIALQAILGSDPLREFLSLVGILKENRSFPTLFFEKA